MSGKYGRDAEERDQLAVDRYSKISRDCNLYCGARGMIGGVIAIDTEQGGVLGGRGTEGKHIRILGHTEQHGSGDGSCTYLYTVHACRVHPCLQPAGFVSVQVIMYGAGSIVSRWRSGSSGGR